MVLKSHGSGSTWVPCMKKWLRNYAYMMQVHNKWDFGNMRVGRIHKEMGMYSKRFQLELVGCRKICRNCHTWVDHRNCHHHCSMWSRWGNICSQMDSLERKMNLGSKDLQHMEIGLVDS